MPMYEFVCSHCGTRFEDLVMSSSSIDEVQCPCCGKKKPERLMSAAAVPGASSSCGSCQPTSKSSCFT